METFAYLGPEGTFTEAALQRVPEADKADHVPLGSVITAFKQVRSGEVDAAVVPIENSVEGGVTATLDAIATGDELHIIREVLVPISFMLVGRPGGPKALDELHSVATHTHEWAQVRIWAEANIPNAAFFLAAYTDAYDHGLLDESIRYYEAIIVTNMECHIEQ